MAGRDDEGHAALPPGQRQPGVRAHLLLVRWDRRPKPDTRIRSRTRRGLGSNISIPRVGTNFSSPMGHIDCEINC
jgi:hypothetical protein